MPCACAATACPAIQITTGSVCHLDAEMVSRAMERLDLDALDILIIENVGNLVCPAVYDLGENLRVVLLSVTEGEDKPLKYPVMFQSAQVVVVNKTDIAAAVGFDRETALAQHPAGRPQRDDPRGLGQDGSGDGGLVRAPRGETPLIRLSSAAPVHAATSWPSRRNRAFEWRPCTPLT